MRLDCAPPTRCLCARAGAVAHRMPYPNSLAEVAPAFSSPNRHSKPLPPPMLPIAEPAEVSGGRFRPALHAGFGAARGARALRACSCEAGDEHGPATGAGGGAPAHRVAGRGSASAQRHFAGRMRVSRRGLGKRGARDSGGCQRCLCSLAWHSRRARRRRSFGTGCEEPVVSACSRAAPPRARHGCAFEVSRQSRHRRCRTGISPPSEPT